MAAYWTAEELEFESREEHASFLFPLSSSILTYPASYSVDTGGYFSGDITAGV
jgi:hypothetical protein